MYPDLCTNSMYTTINTKKQFYPETPPLRYSMQHCHTALEALAHKAISSPICWTRSCLIFKVIQKLDDITTSSYCFPIGHMTQWKWRYSWTRQISALRISLQPVESIMFCFLSEALLLNAQHHVCTSQSLKRVVFYGR